MANWISILTNKPKAYDQIILWAESILGANMLNIETVVQTPWSSVLKISTPKGQVYLKQTPPELFIEVDIIQICRNLCKITDIPEVIAENKSLHCFLMKECGDASLRTLFDGHLNVDILMQGLQVYKTMQQATASHVDAFLQAGVPDWRLDKFSILYQDLVTNEAFLKSHGLETEQIKKLQDSLPSLEAWCLGLAHYGIPECLNHSDFHENNMLYCGAAGKVSIIDLGETAINHPFFSLAAFEKIPCNRYQVQFGSPDYQTLHDICFQGWLASDDDLQKALVLTEKLLPIYLTFAHMRLVNATCSIALSNIPRMNDRIKEGFLWFIKNLEGP
ncbi:MAG: phosphotransferase [Gammaproteobacteria bacterium]|nr:phosphotransferase [Gammaproteobacteria bacterium]